MSGKIDGVPRELLEVIANSSERTMAEINAAIQQAREIIAAPVVERQQPVAWRYQSCAGGLWYLSSSEHNARTFQCNGLDGGVEPLYTSPPAPVAVVLPVRRYIFEKDYDDEDRSYSMGWNACLDKVKELNQ